MNFITVLNTPQAFKIAIVKNLFDMENIQYRIFDEFTNSAAGIAGIGISGMRVQVIEGDLERAQNILKQAEFN